jgi:hypothetical protein
LPYNGKLKVRHKEAYNESFINLNNQNKEIFLKQLNNSSEDKNIGLAFLRAYELKKYLLERGIEVSGNTFAKFHPGRADGLNRSLTVILELY